MKFQKTALILALSTVSGYSLADLTYTSNYDNKVGGVYSQANGISSSVNSAQLSSSKSLTDQTYNSEVVNATPSISTGKVSDGWQNYQTYSYQETRKGQVTDASQFTNTKVDANQLAHEETVYDSKTATGTVVRTAHTKVALDSNGQEIVGTAQRDADSSFAFMADDMGKVADATRSSNYTRNVNTQYTDADARNTVVENQTKYSQLSNIQKYDAQGKAVVDAQGNPVYLVVGTLQDDRQSKDVSYHSTVNAQGQIKSKNSAGILNEHDEQYDNATRNVNYARNENGQIIGIYGIPNSNYVQESNITDTVSQTTNQTKKYDDVSVISNTSKNTSMNQTTQQSLVDGFTSINRNQQSDSLIQYHDGQDQLSSISTNSTKNEQVDRNFVVNSKGVATVENVYRNSNSTEQYQSQYQPSHYTKGTKAGQDYQILDNGVDSRSTNSAVQKIQNRSGSDQTTTFSNGLVTFDRNKNDSSAEYARSLQENIEVNRQLKQVSSESHQNLTTRQVTADRKNTPSAISGDIALTTGATNLQWSGIQLNKNSAGELVPYPSNETAETSVKTWQDENGQQHYYVVLGTDLNGNEIRSEVKAKNTTPSLVNVATLQNSQSTKDYKEVVQHQKDVAYQLDAKESTLNKETSKDGKIIFDSAQTATQESIKLYTVGKNPLNREKTQSYENSTLSSNVTVDDKGNLIVQDTKKNIEKGTGTTKQYQNGQAKQWEHSSNLSTNQQYLNQNNQIISEENKLQNKKITKYAEGKDQLDRSYNYDQTSSKVTKDQFVIAKSDIYGVDENGQSLASRNGVLAIDELGQEVNSTQPLKTISTEGVRDQSLVVFQNVC